MKNMEGNPEKWVAASAYCTHHAHTAEHSQPVFDMYTTSKLLQLAVSQAI